MAQALGGGVAIQAGHLAVHQDKVVGNLADGLQDLDAVSSRIRRIATGWESHLTVAVDTVICPSALMDLCARFDERLITWAVEACIALTEGEIMQGRFRHNPAVTFDDYLEIRPEAGGGQYGFSYDTRGRKFVCSNSDHLQMFLYDDRYAARNPYYSMPAPRRSIAADGGAAEVYRISPDEPWRIIRTRWRISGGRIES
mgnify:CR=1 FL=1